MPRNVCTHAHHDRVAVHYHPRAHRRRSDAQADGTHAVADTARTHCRQFRVSPRRVAREGCWSSDNGSNAGMGSKNLMMGVNWKTRRMGGPILSVNGGLMEAEIVRTVGRNLVHPTTSADSHKKRLGLVSQPTRCHRGLRSLDSRVIGCRVSCSTSI
jgi:hypothetical protein